MKQCTVIPICLRISPLLLTGVDLPLDLMSVHRNPAVLDPERDCLMVAKHFKYGL